MLALCIALQLLFNAHSAYAVSILLAFAGFSMLPFAGNINAVWGTAAGIIAVALSLTCIVLVVSSQFDIVGIISSLVTN